VGMIFHVIPLEQKRGVFCGLDERIPLGFAVRRLALDRKPRSVLGNHSRRNDFACIH